MRVATPYCASAAVPCFAAEPRRRICCPPALAALSTPAAQEAPALSAEEISITLGSGTRQVQVLRGATLRVPRGTLHMLLGPNGCGKARAPHSQPLPHPLTPAGQSTLLRVCAGLLRPSGGRLRVDAPRAFVFQNPDHQVVMPSAGADVAFGLGRLGLPPAEVAQRVEEALAAVGLQVRPGRRGVTPRAVDAPWRRASGCAPCTR